MASLGMLPTVASIVRADSPVVGFVVHMAIACAIGAAFGLLVADQRAQSSETLFWGLIYGGVWWFLGPQTLLPLFVGDSPAWDLRNAQVLLPSLIGHLFYGATTGVVFSALRRGDAGLQRPGRSVLLRGIFAGLAATALLYLVVDLMAGVSLGWLFFIGALAGLGYPLLFTANPEGPGPALIRGVHYGFLWWVLAGLTLPPLLRDGALDWSIGAAQAAVDRLPAYLLLGAGTALGFTWLGSLGRGLFTDDVRMLRHESLGTRGLQALGFGAVAGLAGGLVFTVVMVLVDVLPTVAGMVGARSATAGLIVHLLIAQVIGVSYAVLFRRRSFDLVSGIGWGVSYGFFWWVLGALTLLPMLTGGAPQWNAAGIAAAFPSLVGHLGYGASLGIIYYRLEVHANPWWITRTEAEASRVAARRDQTLGPAPALWGLTVLIAVTIPLLNSG
jgi:uncharacterized membrane protein YagU involved in acid resistance